MSRPILIASDAAYSYVSTAQFAVQKAIGQVHGDAFAESFMSEYRDAVLRVAQARVCGRTEAAIRAETIWLASYFDKA